MFMLVFRTVFVVAQITYMTKTLHAHPIVMAHRGCCANGKGGHAPENTLAAFEYAHATGAVMFETDLRFTSDGEIVIIHDATLDRTTNCSGEVSNWTLSDIRNKCDAGSWLGPEFAGLRVPTVRDLMDFLASSAMSVVLDLKVRGLVGPVVEAVGETEGVDASQLIASINFHNDAGDVVPRLPRSTVLLNPNIDSPVPSVEGADGAKYFGDLRGMGVDVVFPSYPVRGKKAPTLGDLGDAAARYGVQVWTWTVDTPQLWDDVTAAGARVVCTNDPAGALEYFRAQQDCVAEQCADNKIPPTITGPPIGVSKAATTTKYENSVRKRNVFPIREDTT